MSTGRPRHAQSAPVESKTTSVPPPVKSSRPHPWEMIIHPFKTVGFINDLARDRHISWIRKALYVAPIILLIVALLLPESVLAALVAAALPVVGPLADLPADAVVDWAFVGLAAYALLGILPQAIVSQHHAERFHPKRLARQRRQ